MIIDSHAHLNFKAFDEDREAVIKKTQENGLVCINVGTKLETSRKAVALADQYENLYAAIGLHPVHIKNDFLKIRMDEEEGGFTPAGEDFLETEYVELAKNKKVVAVGEIGLDYYYKPKTTEKLKQFKEKQKEVFLQQLNFAKKVNLPLIIHCRMAHQDMAQILAEQDFHNGVIHCFTGNIAEAKSYLDLGFYIGVNGIIFKLPFLDEVMKFVPLEKMVMETDCPYLTPPQENGKRNEPMFIKHTVQKIADLQGVSFDKVAQKTTQNAKKLFNI